MAPKPFEQVFPGQNDPNRQPKKGKVVDPAEWERKQRLKEYRIAARREKRNRKSDEKKQRKLNATILRRMTRNPAKYNKNAGRNRLRAIEQERRKIHASAINMAQRLAAVYDPSGALFNVRPVTTLEDGRIVTLEAIERKKEKEAEKAKLQEAKERDDPEPAPEPALAPSPFLDTDRLNPDRMKLLIANRMPIKNGGPQPMSKTQMKKQEMYTPRPPPPKPTIPEGIDIPSDEEENWLDLWNLPDEELERRVIREKKRKARERKDLRIRQKTGKAERRAARDEKRRVYREIKQSWKVIREEERRRRKQLSTMEDEEGRKLAVEIVTMNRALAMEEAAKLGFTLKNVEGVTDVVPRAVGMGGRKVDFDKLEVIGDAASGLKVKDEELRRKPRGNRVDLGDIADEKFVDPIFRGGEDEDFDFNNIDNSLNANFVELGSGAEGQDHKTLNYNHRLRRKLRRALESTEIRKELVVRAAAIKHCEENNIEVPAVLRSSVKPENKRGSRTMPDGTLETAKQERVRARVELAEFNRMAKILRRQAKDMAVEAGIRIYLELMGRIPKREGLDEMVETQAKAKLPTVGPDEGSAAIGGIWPAQSTAAMTMEDFFDSWPMPEDPADKLAGSGDGAMDLDEAEEEEESEDSAAKQLQAEMAESAGVSLVNDSWGKRGNIGVASDSDSESDSDSDTDMSDASRGKAGS